MNRRIKLTLFCFLTSFQLYGNECNNAREKAQDMALAEQLKKVEIEADQRFKPIPNRQRKIMTFMNFNLLNLFKKVGLFVPNPDSAFGKKIKIGPGYSKEKGQRDGQAKAIQEVNADVVTLQEVESKDALSLFEAAYFEGMYRKTLEEGNDERGIDTGDLSKRDLDVKWERRAYKNDLWKDPTMGMEEVKLFSRDFVVKIARDPESGKPLFAVMYGHNKSKRDRPGDRESKILGTAQIAREHEIAAKLSEEFGPDFPWVLMMDANRDFYRDPEAALLRDKKVFLNALDFAQNPIPEAERYSHVYFDPKGERHLSMMDVILVNKAMSQYILDAGIYRYKNPDGSIKRVPESYDERETNPSDHYPPWFTIDFARMYSDFLKRSQLK